MQAGMKENRNDVKTGRRYSDRGEGEGAMSIGKGRHNKCARSWHDVVRGQFLSR